MKLSDVDIKRLLPVFMRNDKFNAYFASILSNYFQLNAEHLKRFPLWNSLSDLLSDECDLLAYELNIKWYDKTETTEQKKKAIENGMKFKFEAGQKTGLEYALNAIFNNKAIINIKEWFDYNGQPYHFFVVITVPSGQSVTAELITEIEDKIKKLKNIRSILDGVSITKQFEANTITAIGTSSYYMAEKSLGQTDDINEKFII